MSRRSKIARLPSRIREDLNIKLDDGEPGEAILEWLNADADVQRLLIQQFDGTPITKQNLSEWRRSGYQEWIRHEQACDFIRDMDREAFNFSDACDEQTVSDLLAAKVSVELAQVAQALLGERATPAERWKQLKELLPLIAQFRRADCRAADLHMKKEEWGWKKYEHDLKMAHRNVRERLEEKRWEAEKAENAKTETASPG